MHLRFLLTWWTRSNQLSFIHSLFVRVWLRTRGDQPICLVLKCQIFTMQFKKIVYIYLYIREQVCTTLKSFYDSIWHLTSVHCNGGRSAPDLGRRAFLTYLILTKINRAFCWKQNKTKPQNLYLEESKFLSKFTLWPYPYLVRPQNIVHAVFKADTDLEVKCEQRPEYLVSQRWGLVFRPNKGKYLP